MQNQRYGASERHYTYRKNKFHVLVEYIPRIRGIDSTSTWNAFHIYVEWVFAHAKMKFLSKGRVLPLYEKVYETN